MAIAKIGVLLSVIVIPFDCDNVIQIS